MKMIFTGKVKKLMGTYIMFQKIVEKNYMKEWREGKVKYYWFQPKDAESEEHAQVIIETNVPGFAKEMKKDWDGIRGRVKRASLRSMGIKVELKEG